MELAFEWDKAKAITNAAKHGITFEEAKTVFNDIHAIAIADPDHPNEEERYIAVGLSHRGNLLVVVYVERGAAIRLISSRKAMHREWRTYEQRGR